MSDRHTARHDSLAFECPNPACRHQGTMPTQHLGHYVRCPRCRTKFQTSTSGEVVQTLGAPPLPTATQATSQPPPSPEPPLPERIGRFQVRALLGAGAFGVVYRAYDPHLEREVALKVPRSGALATARRRARFVGDAQAAARLRHPHIVPVYDVGQEGEQSFIASAFIDGEVLSEALPQPASPHEAARVVRALAEALAYAHAEGIIHRDVKPDNVMLDRAGQPHLIDFGLARRPEASEEKDAESPPMEADANGHRTLEGQWLGTPSYMCPEAAAGLSHEATPAFDQYSLGVTLYELLTGTTPFEGPVAVILYHAVHTAPLPPGKIRSDLPRDLEAICLRAMAKRPEDRYPSCRELADDLGRFLAGEAVHARPPSLVERAARWGRREPRLAIACGLAGLAILAVAVLGALVGVTKARSARELQVEYDRAEHQRQQADEARLQAMAKEREARLSQTKLLFDQGTAEGNRGEMGQALLWLAEGVRHARQAGDGDLDRALRYNLAAWRCQVHALLDARPLSLEACAVLPVPGGTQLLVAESEKRINRGQLRYYSGVLVPRGPVAGGPKGALSALQSDARLKRLVALGRDGEVTVWAWRGSNLVSLGNRPKTEVPRALAVALSPDGMQLLVGCENGRALHYTLGEESREALPAPNELEHRLGQEVRCVAFSPDGQSLLTGAAHGLAGELRLWRADGRLIGRPIPLRYRPHAAAFSPSPGVFAVALGSLFKGEASLWRFTGDDIHPWGQPLPHQAEVYSVAFHPSGELLLTGGQDRAARLWDVNSGGPFGTPMRHGRDVRVAGFAADGQSVLTVCDEQVLRRWQVAPGLRPDHSHTFPGLLVSPVLALARSGDGKRLVAGGSADAGGHASVLDAATLRPLLTLPLSNRYPNDPVRAVACDQTGRRLLTGSGIEELSRGHVILWDEKGRPVVELPHAGLVRCVALSADGLTLATGCDDGIVRVWTESGKTSRRWHKVGTRIYAVSLSPNGRRLAAGGRDSLLHLLDLTSAHPPLTQRHPDVVLSVAFGPDQSTLIVGYAGGARVWKWTSTGLSSAGPPLAHQAGILAVALSRDGRSALTAGTDGQVLCWDVATGRPLGPAWSHGGSATGAVFGPDETTVCTANLGDHFRGGAWQWRRPGLVEGSAERLARWAESVTGLQLDQGSARQLALPAWKASRDHLARLGGLPAVENEARILAWDKQSVGTGPVVRREPGRSPLRRARPLARPPTGLGNLLRVLNRDKPTGPFATAKEAQRFILPGAHAVTLIDLRRALSAQLVNDNAAALLALLADLSDGPLAIARATGIDLLADVDGAVLSLAGQEREETAVALRGRFDPKRLKFAGNAPAEQGKVYSVRRDKMEVFVALISPDWLVVAPRKEDVTGLLKPPAEKGAPLLQGWGGGLSLYAHGVASEKILKWLSDFTLPISPRLARSVTASVGIDTRVRAEVRVEAVGAKEAKQIASQLDLLKAIALALLAGQEEAPAELADALKAMKVRADRTSAVVSLELTGAMVNKLLKRD